MNDPESLLAADLARLAAELEAGRASGNLLDERDVFHLLDVAE